MKERGIIFTGESVRGILADRKTVTRRLVKYHPSLGDAEQWCADVTRSPDFGPIVGDYRRFSPYGVGSRLYVKETWRPRNALDLVGGTHGTKVLYPADGARAYFESAAIPNRWKMPTTAERGNVSPLFMPRWASRITLEVTAVRVERLHDITEEDALAEGVRFDGRYFDGAPHKIKGTPRCMNTAREAYADVWDHINPKTPWSTNVWVWVVCFRRVPS